MSISFDADAGIFITAGGLANARQQPSEAWRVSWLNDLDLDRNQAISAMTIADHLMSNRGDRVHLCDGKCPRWPFIVQWASEYGRSGEQACTEIEDYAATKGFRR